MMQVVQATHAGACYGVKRALDLAYQSVEEVPEAFTLGPLIHNPGVVAELESQGVHEIHDISQAGNGTVIIRSHGVTPDVLEELDSRGLPVIDATCPHVARAQKAAADLARQGCLVIVVGEAGHPEVEGLTAYARREGAKVIVVSDAGEVPEGLKNPVGVVVQTTQKRAQFDAVVDAIRRQGIAPKVKDTICSATRKRQEEAADLAKSADVMIVIGGRNSSNTTRLSEICAGYCPRTHHIESAVELEASWFDGADMVGVTAGASTPESQIAAVVQRVESFASGEGVAPCCPDEGLSSDSASSAR